jgi:nucleoside-diphosphate-sugar epimerase
MREVVILGAGGLVSPFLVQQLSARGIGGICYSRRAPLPPQGNFIIRPFANIRADCPPGAILISPLRVGALAELIPELPKPRRVISFSSSQVYSSESRNAIESAERALCAHCNDADISWTIFRPTMIYYPPIDRNVTAVARMIRKLGFFPLSGTGSGLRQPVHAEDLAVAAADAINSSAAEGRLFDLPGGETLRFRVMVARIFRALHMPPVMIPIPRFALRLSARALPALTKSTGLPDGVIERVIALMGTDMVLDAAAAKAAFGYRARPFTPIFPKQF